MKEKAWPGLLGELSWEKPLMLFVGLLFRCFGEKKEDLNCQFYFINLFSVFIIAKKKSVKYYFVFR